VQAAPKSPGAFASAAPSATAGAATAVLSRAAVAANPPSHSPYVGAALSPADIQSIMAHAGAGCPLGPCHGCPHNDAITGACRA
jgi:hypothetical protein